MNMASLEELLSSPKEAGEPQLKKCKTDNPLQWQLLERPCYADKKLFLSFPEMSWNFDRNVLESHEKSNTQLSPSTRQRVPFKPCMNANLQSRLLGNISYVKKWTHGDKDYNGIKYAASELNENNNSFFTETESWVLHAKEKEDSIDSGNISKENELPTINTFFNHVLAGRLITIDSLFTDKPEFERSENGTGSQEYEILNSGKQDDNLKPVSVVENSVKQSLHLFPPVSNFVKIMSDLRSVLYEHYFFVDEKSNKLSSKKQTNNTSKRNKAFNHMYIPYSKNRKAVVPKLIKHVGFESFVQDKIIYYSITVTEKNGILIFKHPFLLNTRQRVISNEKITKECLFFSRDTATYFIFSVSTSEKEQIRKPLIPYTKSLPNNNFYVSTLRILNPLNSVSIISENSGIKYHNMQMIVPIKTYIQQKNRKIFKENGVLRPNNKLATGRFRNTNLIRKNKYISKYTAICSRQIVKCGNWEDGQENPCSFVDKKYNFFYVDTFNKICLNTDSEADQILSIDKVKFTDENCERGNKRYVAVNRRVTISGSCTLTCSYISTNLFANYILLEQKSKDKESMYFKDTNADNQWQKGVINTVSLPGLKFQNMLKCFLYVDQYRYSQMLVVRNDDHKDRIINIWHRRIALRRRRKQNGFEFGQIKHVLQYQSLCSSESRFSERLKHPTVQHDNFLFQKDVLLSSRDDSEVMSVKLNADNAEKIENVPDQSCSGKSKEHQNLIELPFKDQSVKFDGSASKLMIVSSIIKPKHFEEAAEEHFSFTVKTLNTFEMKSQFDLVLEELRMFNEITKEKEDSLVYKEREIREKDSFTLNHSENVVNEDSQAICKNRTKVCVSSIGTSVNTSMMKQQEYEQCSYEDLMVKKQKEQEVPCEDSVSSISDEELFYSPSEECSDPRNKQPPPWNPAFEYNSCTNKKVYSFQTKRGNGLCDGINRIQPLKTCLGPLRIGLSRRAKPRQLHPYLK